MLHIINTLFKKKDLDTIICKKRCCKYIYIYRHEYIHPPKDNELLHDVTKILYDLITLLFCTLASPFHRSVLLQWKYLQIPSPNFLQLLKLIKSWRSKYVFERRLPFSLKKAFYLSGTEQFLRANWTRSIFSVNFLIGLSLFMLRG